MRLGIISDTHDRLPVINQALDYFKHQNVDLVIHCGDWKSLATVTYFAQAAASLNLPVRGVLGNNDADEAAFLQTAQSAPGDFVLYSGVFEMVCDGVAVAAYHGHHKPTLRKVLASSASVILLGHSHKPRIEQDANKLVINPGSTAFAIPRSKAFIPSVALYDSDTHTATLHYLASE